MKNKNTWLQTSKVGFGVERETGIQNTPDIYFEGWWWIFDVERLSCFMKRPVRTVIIHSSTDLNTNRC